MIADDMSNYDEEGEDTQATTNTIQQWIYPHRNKNKFSMTDVDLLFSDTSSALNNLSYCYSCAPRTIKNTALLLNVVFTQKQEAQMPIIPTF